jgi:hypothetical protein
MEGMALDEITHASKRLLRMAIVPRDITMLGMASIITVDGMTSGVDGGC